MFSILKRIKRRLEQPKRYKQLFSEIRKIKAKNIMEVGTWNGNRAVQMIICAQEFVTNKPEIHYFGFDLFESMDKEIHKQEISKWPPTQLEVEEKLEKTGATIHLYQGYTQETLPAQLAVLPKMDFIFIDGGHSFETVENDWNYSKQLMHEQTVVIFDDYWPNRADFGGSKRLVDSLNRNEYSVEIMPVTDRFNNVDFGKLVIQFAKVTKNKQHVL